MSSATTKCPRCNGAAKSARANGEHAAAHQGVHQFAHGHPTLALVAGLCWGISKLMPKEFRCTACGHTFRP